MRDHKKDGLHTSYLLGTGDTPTNVGLLPRSPPCKLVRSKAVAHAKAATKKAATHFMLEMNKERKTNSTIVWLSVRNRSIKLNVKVRFSEAAAKPDAVVYQGTPTQQCCAAVAHLQQEDRRWHSADQTTWQPTTPFTKSMNDPPATCKGTDRPASLSAEKRCQRIQQFSSWMKTPVSSLCPLCLSG